MLTGALTRRLFAFAAPETAAPEASEHGQTDAGGRAGIRLAASGAASAVADFAWRPLHLNDKDKIGPGSVGL